MAQCPECGGTGKVDDAGEKITCPECGGTGEIEFDSVKEPPKED